MKSKANIRGLDIFSNGKEIELVYRVLSKKEKFLRVKKSENTIHFSGAAYKFEIISHDDQIDISEIEEMAISKISPRHFSLTYLKKDESEKSHLYCAVSRNGKLWGKSYGINDISSFGVIVGGYEFHGENILYFGKGSIKYALSADLKKWKIEEHPFLKRRKNFFDQKSLKVINAFVANEGITLFYSAKNENDRLCLGIVLLDKNNPSKVLWRSDQPLWEQPSYWSADKIHIVGVISTKENFILYFQKHGGRIFAQPLQYLIDAAPKFLLPVSKRRIGKVEHPKLERFHENPVLKPCHENPWEASATFNSAAVHLDDRVHLVYRAQGHDGASVLGYASSKDGFKIHERLASPVYVPTQSFECNMQKTSSFFFPYMSGGGWGGCEDPRLTHVGDRIYMTYTAFNGSHPPGVALTSIRVKDFLAKKWNWSIPRLISRFGQIQKNWVIFPEKINGKYAIMHSISPSILINYFDSLDNAPIIIDSYHNGHNYNVSRWDNIMRGVGAPPIKTDYGWLVLYHAMDRNDPNRYKVGAMILDYENPEIILHRSSGPILEPSEHYENEGYKAGVVYVCGAVVKDETLFVYYGGADMVVAVATAPLKQFINQLISSQKITLAKVQFN